MQVKNFIFHSAAQPQCQLQFLILQTLITLHASFFGLLIRGARDGEVVKGLAYGQDLQRPRLPTVWLVFTPRYRRHVWVAAGEFVVGSLLCSERFFSGYSDFPLS